MVSSWKIRRELGRLGQQVRGLGERLTDPLGQRRLDRTVARSLPQIDGVLPVGDKIALYLIYQPAGLSTSTLETCRMLSQAGYTPFVVSNAPLKEEDRTRLKAVVWRAVERPNFGYDFGGYRDGLTCLRQWGTTAEEMLILNDSVWLPILPKADFMDRVAAEPAEIAGAILRTRGREQFLESYLYRIRRVALEHPAFRAYWENLQLTSNKYHVIRRGERGFSAAMQAAHLRVAAVYDSSDIPEKISKQSDEFLRLTLQYGAYIDAGFAAEARQLLASDGPDWRQNMLAHFNNVLVKRQAYSSFPYAYMRLMDYPLMKKSADPVNKAWRKAYLHAVNAKDVPSPSAVMLDEIRASD